MFTSMVAALKMLDNNGYQRGKHMYEVGKKRQDGKYNIWKRIQLGHYWEWIIDTVQDDIKEAMEYAARKNQAAARKKA